MSRNMGSTSKNHTAANNKSKSNKIKDLKFATPNKMTTIDLTLLFIVTHMFKTAI